MSQKHMPFREIALTAVAVAVVIWIGTGPRDVAAAQPTGTLADFFTGPPPTFVNSDDVTKARVTLTAGARAHWHSHGWGQLLLPEEGRGRFQVLGGPVQELRPGDPVFTDGGGAEWGEPVGDEEYLAEPSR